MHPDGGRARPLVVRQPPRALHGPVGQGGLRPVVLRQRPRGHHRRQGGQQQARPRGQPRVQPLHRRHRGGPAAVPPLQPPDAGRLRLCPLRGAPGGVAVHLRGLRLHRPGIADREVPHVQRPAARKHCDLQRQVLHLLQPAADQLPGCVGLLQCPGRLARGRVEPGPPGLPFVGALASAQGKQMRDQIFMEKGLIFILLFLGRC